MLPSLLDFALDVLSHVNHLGGLSLRFHEEFVETKSRDDEEQEEDGGQCSKNHRHEAHLTWLGDDHWLVCFLD